MNTNRYKIPWLCEAAEQWTQEEVNFHTGHEITLDKGDIYDAFEAGAAYCGHRLLNNLLISALRYALTRRTYVAFEVMSTIIETWPWLSAATRDLIVKDILLQQKLDNWTGLGEWQRVLDLYHQKGI